MFMNEYYFKSECKISIFPTTKNENYIYSKGKEDAKIT